MTLSDMQVLRAVARACSPLSAYIGDELMRDHMQHITNGGRGHPPTTARILRRLRALAANGLLKQSDFPKGYYGYRWDLTDAGRAALREVSHDA